VLDALSVSGRVLLVLPEPHEAVEKSFRNLPFVRITSVRGLSTYDVLAADRVLFTRPALDMMGGGE
jgi:ribosomal protein L4